MPTRTTYRQAGCRALSPEFYTGTATSGSTTALVEMTDWPFKTTLSADERFENFVLHRPNAVTATDRARTVKTYDAAAGQFTVDNPYSIAAYTGGIGESVELLGHLDPDAIHRMISEALKFIPVLYEATFTPASNSATQHTMASHTWLTDPDWVFQVGYLASGESRTDIDPFKRSIRGEPQKIGNVVYLTGFSLPTTVTGYALCYRPAYTYCRASAGTFGDLTAGLTAETDEAVPQEDWVAAGVRMFAWNEYRDLFWPGNKQLADAEVERAAGAFEDISAGYYTQPERTFRQARAFGLQGRQRVVGFPSP